MNTRRILTNCIFAILTFLFVAGPVAAKSPAVSPTGSEFLLRAPEARAQGWQEGLLKFMSEHQDFNNEQANAIQRLADFDSPAAFSHTLQPSQRAQFAQRLDGISRALSYRDYLQVLRSFDDELRVWLVRNGLASQAEAATETCTCSSSGGGCSSGYTCADVTCVHEGGTTHNGRCSGGADE